eukprot:gb/GECG01016188.1/.p1 GENE.gb/GECG01016188.1/~~gb/GECG01016188.1/.p1  ORF type:complete len:186 (+),score=25.16 gb/GECG01016188.1/:1-558(+)
MSEALFRQNTATRCASHLTDELETLLQDTLRIREEASQLQERLKLYRERVQRYIAPEQLDILNRNDRQNIKQTGEFVQQLLDKAYVVIEPVVLPEKQAAYDKARNRLETLDQQLEQARQTGDRQTLSQVFHEIHACANATKVDSVDGCVIDHKYQSVHLDCQLDHQKALREQWAQLVQKANVAAQ